jgi:UDP-2,4-diacetamido-2,4,6-trideoxy-beta-L-altropyranose hydrolase
MPTKNSRNLVFRVDSSSRLGFGHVIRCLNLADKLSESNKFEIVFISRSLAGSAINIIRDRGYKVCLISEKKDMLSKSTFDWKHDVDRTVEELIQLKPCWMVVDNYEIDYQWHNRVRPYVSNIMVIDDMPNRKFDCDLLLDQTFGRKKSEYASLVSENCKILVGSKFALLNAKFSALRESSKLRRRKHSRIKRVLISFGGSNNSIKLLSTILRGIEYFDWSSPPKIDLVLGHNIDPIDLIKIMLPTLDIKIYKSVNNMQELIFNSDIAFGAAGISTWERCCLGLPTITIGISENQRDSIENVERVLGLYSIGCCEKVSIKDVNKALSLLVEDSTYYRNMIDSAFNICDGLGVDRVYNEILS